MIIQNLSIVNEILKNELNSKVGLVTKIKICRHPEKYYIGNSYRIYVPPISIIFNGQEISTVIPNSKTKLFKYNKDNDSYLDLSNNKNYKKLDEQKESSYVCDHLQSIDVKIKKIRWKEGI